MMERSMERATSKYFSETEEDTNHIRTRVMNTNNMVAVEVDKTRFISNNKITAMVLIHSTEIHNSSRKMNSSQHMMSNTKSINFHTTATTTKT